MQGTGKIKKEISKSKLNYTQFMRLDFLLLFFATITVIFSLFIVSLIKAPTGSNVEVVYQGKVVIREVISQDKIIKMSKDSYPALLGDMEIEIKDNKVRIKKETSPNNICFKQGWTDNTFKALICEPNSVIVRVSNDNNADIPSDIIAGDI